MANALQKARARARAVKQAHGMGLTWSGYNFFKAGGERALAERTGKSLTAQANREINTSYKPVQAAFDKRAGQIKAIDSKRAADEEQFKSWVVQQQATLRSEADTRDKELRSTAAGYQKSLTDRITAIQGQNPAGQPVNALEAAQGTAAIAVGTAQNQGLNRGIGLDRTLMDANQANTWALQATLTAKRQAQTYQAMADNADGAQKAALQQAADLQKRTAELLDGETQKAQLRIAGTQFDQKSQLAQQNAAAGRNVTRRGQTLSHADRVAARKQAAQDKADAFFQKHGVQYTTFSSWSDKRRRRFLASEKKSGGSGSGPHHTATQLEASRLLLSKTVGLIANGVSVKQADGTTTIEKAPPPGSGRVSAWLQAHNVPKEYADAAAHIFWTRHGQANSPNLPTRQPMPKSIADALFKVAGIRGL